MATYTQITSWPFWFRIVSTRMAVLPVERSPMTSSRWPRPIGIIESIALMPVCKGSVTGWRWTTPGALNSSGRCSEALIGSPPSTAMPSGLTMRPTSLLPDRHADDGAGALDRVALADLLPLAEERDADVVLLEVERDAGDVGAEVEHLAGDTVLEPVHAGDAVADLEDGADLGEIGLDVGLGDPLLQDRGDLFRA